MLCDGSSEDVIEEDPGPKSAFNALLREAGARIAFLRKDAGLSRAELAAAAGAHVSTLAGLEQGIRDTSVVVYSRVLLALRCPGIHIDERGFCPIPPAPEVLARGEFRCRTPKPTIVSVIGRRVRELRGALGVSLDETASASGVHMNTLWNLERGLVCPSLSTIYRLYRSLGVRSVFGVENKCGVPDGIRLITKG